MQIDPIYTQLDEFLHRFVSHISIVKATRPINLLEEKTKFFKSKFIYNPQFQYRSPKANLDKFSTQINSLLPLIPNTDIGKLYKLRLLECLTTLNLIKQIGNNQSIFTDLSIQIYDKPQPQFITNALYVLGLPKKPHVPNQFLSISQITNTVQQFLDKYQLTAPISITKNTKNTLSLTRLGKIKIPYRLRRTQNKLNISLEHEIGTHLLRLSNGKKNPYKIFQYGTAKYFQNEEGLAIIKSRINDPHTHLRKTSLSLIATNHALDHSFSQTYHYLQEHTHSQNTLWNLTFRAKRGLADTSQPGALTKDLYFQWAIQTMQQIIADPNLLNYAWNGKASLNELKQFTQPQTNTSITIDQIKNLLDQNLTPQLITPETNLNLNSS